jgi:hypothetical protein
MHCELEEVIVDTSEIQVGKPRSAVDRVPDDVPIRIALQAHLVDEFEVGFVQLYLQLQVPFVHFRRKDLRERRRERFVERPARLVMDLVEQQSLVQKLRAIEHDVLLQDFRE